MFCRVSDDFADLLHLDHLFPHFVDKLSPIGSASQVSLFGALCLKLHPLNLHQLERFLHP